MAGWWCGSRWTREGNLASPQTRKPPPTPQTDHKVHSTQYTVHSTQYTVHSTQYTVHSTQYTVHSTQYTVHSTQYTVHSTQYTVHSTAPGLYRDKIHFFLLKLILFFTLFCSKKTLSASLVGVLGTGWGQECLISPPFSKSPNHGQKIKKIQTPKIRLCANFCPLSRDFWIFLWCVFFFANRGFLKKTRESHIS